MQSAINNQSDDTPYNEESKESPLPVIDSKAIRIQEINS